MPIEFNTDQLLRDLAHQYAIGLLTTEDYLDTMERICRQHAGITSL